MIFRVGIENKNDGRSIAWALDPEFEKVTGRFFYKAKEIEPAAYAHDRTAQQRLWEISSNLTGITENKVDIPPDGMCQ